MSKQKQDVKQQESEKKEGVINMMQFPIILAEAIDTWARNQARNIDDEMRAKFFVKQKYHELGLLVDLSPSTLRSYTDEYNMITPTLLNLQKICLAIQDPTPLEYFSEVSKRLFASAK